MSKITSDFRASALRRGLFIKPAKGESSRSVAYAASIELANLGFVIPPADLEGASESVIVDTIAQARKIIGADRDMTPIYPGFPKQVQELSTMTLLIEQILHYWTGGKLLPNYPAIVREGLTIPDMLRNARMLRVVNAAEAARELTAELVSNPVALSVDDKALLRSCITMQKPTLDTVAEAVKNSRNGENVQSFVSAVKEVGSISASDLALAVIPVASNSDVLLRIVLALFTEPTVASSKSATYQFGAVAESKRMENYTLAVYTLADRNARAVKMLNIPRPVRRAIVEKVGRISGGYKADALVSRQMLWRRVMTAVHPYDFNLSEFQKRAVDIIHSNVEYKTLNSLIEEALANKDATTAMTLTATHQPGNLLRRLVAILRIVKTAKEAKALAKIVKEVGSNTALSTLVSSYNGVISANDDSARVTRVAGLNNTMVSRAAVDKIKAEFIELICKALKKAIKVHLASKPAPTSPVAVVSSMAVPLVRRDASTADRQMDRGSEFAVAGEGDTLRIFGHWRNTQTESGYMDIGLVLLDEKFSHLAVLTWDSWSSHRSIGTYSGDKLVEPGDSAAEYFDLELAKVKEKYPTAIYAAMTIQSYSGWPTSSVDMIAGAMLRSKPESGEVFDARSVATAFKPSTDSLQSVPLAVDLRNGKLIWIDSSSGSTRSGMSSTNDSTIGSIVYDELERPRLTLGELAMLWAKAHGADTVEAPVNQKVLMSLL